MQPKKRKGFEKIGSIRVGETKEDKRKYTYLKLEENVTILVDGEPINLPENRNIYFEKPQDEVNALLEKGVIDEAEAEKRLAKLSELTWLRYIAKAGPAKRD